MLLPFKTTSVILGGMTVLWAGMWVATRPATVPAPVATSGVVLENSASTEALTRLQQELTGLQNRLTQIEHTRSQENLLAQRLAQIEDAQHRLEQEVEIFVAQQPPQVEAATSPAPLDTRTSSQKQEPARPPETVESHTAEDDLEQFEVAFWQEPEDPSWRGEMESTIVATLQELAISDTVLDWVQCQQNACRLEFVHLEGSDEESFMEGISNSEPFTNEFYAESTMDGNGQRRTLVYVARPGQQLFAKPNL